MFHQLSRTFCGLGKRPGLVRHILQRRRFPGLMLNRTAELMIDGHLEYECPVGINEGAKLFVSQGRRLFLGRDSYIGRHVELGAGSFMSLGERATLQDRCILLGNVQVGRYTLFAPNVYISSGQHYFQREPHKLIRDQDAAVLQDPVAALRHNRSVFIGEDCWLGVNSVVMAGVSIGRGCVIGANSVVVRDVPPYSVVAGSPAKLIKQRLAFSPPRHIHWSNPQDIPYFYAGFSASDTARAENARYGGYTARRHFELWLAPFGPAVLLRVRRLSEAPTTLRIGFLSIDIPPDWSVIEVPVTHWPLRCEIDGSAIAVSEAWTE